ncbi:hypothetical protein NEPAR04_0422 [Nematocida parisii]|nr:hypothetical protein NEPAR03_0490 [Nematocida parisii]KAI5126488.1 hypothetical protein NEPAR08_0479 [Nematocida parisii]KAI5140687.1 hypothetical protein NEPAR04_0422 [Nematocida parisii]
METTLSEKTSTLCSIYNLINSNLLIIYILWGILYGYIIRKFFMIMDNDKANGRTTFQNISIRNSKAAWKSYLRWKDGEFSAIIPLIKNILLYILVPSIILFSIEFSLPVFFTALFRSNLQLQVIFSNYVTLGVWCAALMGLLLPSTTYIYNKLDAWWGKPTDLSTRIKKELSIMLFYMSIPLVFFTKGMLIFLSYKLSIIGGYAHYGFIFKTIAGAILFGFLGLEAVSIFKSRENFKHLPKEKDLNSWGDYIINYLYCIVIMLMASTAAIQLMYFLCANVIELLHV